MKSEHDRRDFSRSHTDLTAELRIEGIEPILGMACDVSLKGIFVECEASVPERSACEVTLRLPGGAEQQQIEIQGRVARSIPTGIAVEILRMDTKSYHHLRMLVLLNSKDPDCAEDEFEAHIGLHRRD